MSLLDIFFFFQAEDGRRGRLGTGVQTCALPIYGANKHYGFYPTAGQMRLTRFDGPNVFSWTILDQQLTRHYLPGDWNTLKLRHEGNRFYCHVNGHLVFESSDRGLQGGKVGLAKFRNTVATFRNFRLGKQVDRKSVVEGKSVDLGGRRIIKKKKLRSRNRA